MSEEQKITKIEVSDLLTEVKKLSDTGYRLSQISATALAAGFQIDYSFDKDYHFVDLRVEIPSAKESLPSVSPVYWSAFLYENEIQDLFGITVKGMAVDYQNKFYKLAVKTPFAKDKTREQENNNG
jgi:ech hydrogenase subunit D